MKKLFSTLLLVCFICSLSVSAVNVPYREQAVENPGATAVIIDEDGNEYNIAIDSEDITSVNSVVTSPANVEDIDNFAFLENENVSDVMECSQTVNVKIDGATLASIGTPGSEIGQKWDPSVSVYGYLKSSYLSYTSGGQDYYILTDVSGYWRVSDSTVTLSDRKVNFGCISFDWKTRNQVNEYHPTSNTFSYTTGFSNYVIEGTPSALGSISTVQLSHGTSSKWELKIKAEAFNTIGSAYNPA